MPAADQLALYEVLTTGPNWLVPSTFICGAIVLVAIAAALFALFTVFSDGVPPITVGVCFGVALVVATIGVGIVEIPYKRAGLEAAGRYVYEAYGLVPTTEGVRTRSKVVLNAVDPDGQLKEVTITWDDPPLEPLLDDVPVPTSRDLIDITIAPAPKGS